jgi:hypothetical protein
MVKSDHGDAAKLEKQIAEANSAISVAKKARDEQISQNQIYRLAASYFRKDPADVQPKEFELARWVFSTFSAIAVALAGSVAVLVYYAQERVPGGTIVLGQSRQGTCSSTFNWLLPMGLGAGRYCTGE